MFKGPFDHSIIKRVQEKGLVEIAYINLRDFGIGPHQMVDDTPYGGGVGMVLRVDVVHEAIKFAKKNFPSTNTKTVLLTASGKTFNQTIAGEYAKLDHLILICGHYEGIDDRINHYIDEELSIGDFVLTGGELPAMLITDAVTRLLTGAITQGAVDDESFTMQDEGTLLEYPHFTKPQSYEHHQVPDVLLTGNHAKIAEWRHTRSIEKTEKIRPDLLKKNQKS